MSLLPASNLDEQNSRIWQANDEFSGSLISSLAAHRLTLFRQRASYIQSQYLKGPFAQDKPTMLSRILSPWLLAFVVVAVVQAMIMAPAYVTAKRHHHNHLHTRPPSPRHTTFTYAPGATITSTPSQPPSYPNSTCLSQTPVFFKGAKACAAECKPKCDAFAGCRGRW